MTLKLEDISASYGDKQILRDINISCKPNQLIALVGPNGSGKSTLLKAIAGLIPHSGRMNLPKDLKARSRALAYLAQNSTAPDRRLVRDIVALGRTPFTGPLAKLAMDDHVILATDSPLILADEPVTALDPYFQIAIMDVLKSQSKNSHLIIAALHDLALARKYADRIWVLKDGNIVKDDIAAKALDDETLADVFRIRPDGTRI